MTKKYEYFTFPLNGVDAWQKRERFDTLGKNGWQLAGIDDTQYIFMRQIEDEVQEQQQEPGGLKQVRGNFFKGHKR